MEEFVIAFIEIFVGVGLGKMCESYQELQIKTRPYRNLVISEVLFAISFLFINGG